MKKTTLSTIMHLNTVQALEFQKLHSLKGGCGSEYPAVATTHTDNDTNDDEGGGGGEEGFIPPPGGD